MTYALAADVRASLRAADRRIVITGAGGWLGMATLELLSDALGPALDARVACFGSSRRTLALLDGRTVEQSPLVDLAQLAPQPSLVLHLAFLTKDRAETMSEADYRHANRALSGVVLDALDAIDARAVFVASSGAARFVEDSTRSDAMRLYGDLKRADEDAFAGWAEARNRRAIIVRLFNIAGPHINKVRSYALSALILDALEAGAIRVTAPHCVVRGYVAIRELMSLVFALLLDERQRVVRFDTGGEAMEMGEVAAAVGAEFAGVVERNIARSDGEDVYLGDPACYDRLLREYDIDAVSFAQQVRETGDYLRNLAMTDQSPGAKG